MGISEVCVLERDPGVIIVHRTKLEGASPHDEGDGVWVEVEADSQEQLHVLMADLAQRVRLLDVGGEVGLLGTLSLVDRDTPVPVATVCVCVDGGYLCK
jgi:hypothetical protein